MSLIQTRRQFLTGLSLAGAAGLLRAPSAPAAEGGLEITTVRIARVDGICIAPQYVAEELLRAEGFTDVRYVPLAPGLNTPEGIASGEVDFGSNFASVLVAGLDRGIDLTVLGGVHVGCFELFVKDATRSLTELKGKRVGITFLGSPGDLFLAAMAAHVGIDPGKDLHWVESNPRLPEGADGGRSLGKPVAMDLFTSGKVDAFLGFPPDPQELRAQNIGRVIVNSALDRPWSQYFCCMLAGNRAFVRNSPVATKAVVRAMLKADDLCVSDPARAAQWLVDGGFTPRYDHALQTLTEVPYDKWREYDPEDTIRFYALRLHEVGMVKSSPQKIIADGTDWRFFNEVKRELKA
jgi:NitT/TauT family transport system substrate-binding protein